MSTLAFFAQDSIAVNKVFVDGGQPDVTYVPRTGLNLEDTVLEYEKDGGAFLSITGPTKTGKTVLIRHALPKNVLTVEGGQLRSVDDFFESLAHSLRMPHVQSYGRTTEVGGKASIPFVKTVNVHVDHERKTSEEFKISKFDVLGELKTNKHMLVIEDFHLVPPGVRTETLQNLKALVRDGLRVILLSVPHRGFDAVRAENDLNLRVQHFPIPHWTPAELIEIANKGCHLLGAVPQDGLIAMLAENAYGNPQLMQLMCKQICRDNKIESGAPGQNQPLTLDDPGKFFLRVARKAIAPTDLEAVLKARARKRTRIGYALKSGEQADIYMLTLRAVSELLPTTTLSAQKIFEKAQSKLKRPAALQENQITAALHRMSDAVASRPGERVLEWDGETNHVHIVDPGLAFLIKWTT